MKTGKRLWRNPGRILDFLFVPVTCVLIWLRLIDAFGILNPNLILAALVLIYGIRHAVSERSIGQRFSIGFVGAALLLVLVTEWLVYLFFIQKSNPKGCIFRRGVFYRIGSDSAFILPRRLSCGSCFSYSCQYRFSEIPLTASKNSNIVQRRHHWRNRFGLPAVRLFRLLHNGYV